MPKDDKVTQCGLSCEISIPDGATSDEIRAVALGLVHHVDGLHRAMGGHGLVIDNVVVTGEDPNTDEGSTT